MTSKPDPTETDPSEKATVSVIEQVTLVVDNTRALVKAELDYLRSRIGYSIKTGKHAALFGIAALLAFFGAVIALTVGLLMTLSPYVGPGWATVIVTAIFVGAGMICVFRARAWIAKMSFPEIDRSENENVEET